MTNEEAIEDVQRHLDGRAIPCSKESLSIVLDLAKRADAAERNARPTPAPPAPDVLMRVAEAVKEDWWRDD